MTLALSAWTSHGPTASFVLLWSSGALFAKWGLASASPLAFLLLRFALAFIVLVALGLARGRLSPAPGTALRTGLTGALLIAGYSIFYLLALDAGLTPGVLATTLGVQPVLTLLWMERGFPLRRLAGLGLALAGLVLVVYDSIALSGMAAAGIGFALACLGCVTTGSILQKRLAQAPMDVLPLQYAVSLVLCGLLLPWQPLQVEWNAALLLCVAWLGLVISVVATLLLYRLIQAGDLVNVTSLFYLVPVGTAALDWLVLGNRLAPLALAGMAAIVLGLVLVLRPAAAALNAKA
ncbi:MAG: Permease of the drug/metabolite transporter (DMT) superfamily [uncultured Ramlibacter sp.]|uniref:Permease of the drug/metabolite transporter (DMT) superfamily n=1 Tax=uncultured Ramlibacter sp. TaxID=260755 RepID=A0A6J4PXK1_9BURK|nr:MAG: Permease of the drug/metabolite transporter (DMT) superfamily [uncultured Ramlibacter sp.]